MEHEQEQTEGQRDRERYMKKGSERDTDMQREVHEQGQREAHILL